MSDRPGPSASAAVAAGFVSPAVQAALDRSASDGSISRGASRASASRWLGPLVRRLIPGMISLEFAILWWEFVNRSNFAHKETFKSGPGPGDPLFVPQGYRFATSTFVNGPFPSPPFDGGGPLTWANTGGFAGWAIATTLPAVRFWDFGQTGVFDPPPPMNPQPIPFAPSVRFAYPGVNGVPTSYNTFGVELWEWTGTGPGSQIRRAGDVVEWTPPAWEWPLSPDALPSIMPSTSPFSVPPGRQLMPIPQRLIYRVSTLPQWLTDRVSVSPPPTRPIADPDADVGVIPQRPPAEATAPPDVVTVTHTASGRSIGMGPGHAYVAPPPGTREVKIKAPRSAAGVVMNVLTETHDFVRALHKALPKSCQRSRSWRDKETGKWHGALASSMLRDIGNCAAYMDIRRAVINVLTNEIQDRAVGKAARALNSRTSALFGTTGIQGAGTRLSRAQKGAEDHWSGAISQAGDAFADHVARTYGSVTPFAPPGGKPPDLRHRRRRKSQ